ncbi:lasso RiPP family leader peptide-containing protein [Dissulfuribacter thermophilus]|uniref:lasso RiPP family leader peptide-containing protein n=1 Tax=Dissulfuribacter thermophilus TaxID=1156395 RepID=UPI00082CD9EB|nr:lasso RiPP family leader peptide-containing protein [Dissulfuribacter thermophilus]
MKDTEYDIKKTKENRKQYSAPILSRLGTVENLTLGHKHGPGTDAAFIYPYHHKGGKTFSHSHHN